MDILENASLVILDTILFVMSKMTIFFWNIFRLIGRVFGYHGVQRRLPSDIDLARYEMFSAFLGSVCLYRHETSEETFLYGHCHNEDWDVVVKGVLRENKVSGKNDFYLYLDHPENEMTEGRRMPTPITISFLDSILHPKDE